MKHESAWIIFCFLFVSFFYIIFLSLAVGFPFIFKFTFGHKINSIVFFVNYGIIMPPVFLITIYRIINDFNVTVRLSKKFRNQDVRFKSKNKNIIIYWIYKHIYLKPLNVKNNEMNHQTIDNKTKIKIQIYIFFYLSLIILASNLIINVWYTIWYFTTEHRNVSYGWIFWFFEFVSFYGYVVFWRCRTYHYCKNHNLTKKSFESNRLITWIISSIPSYPYKQFILCKNAFHWNEEFEYKGRITDSWIIYR
ncbi:hypothetical protein SAMN02745154_00531 [Mycoplasmopsis verecunda]|uniref:Uncharacterized protein n=1 Tax=Mycoplasmopsis verecunda TaxID=171291 RepID=A0A1T4LT82_9BACT|nr:hypothetical protein SAMN02745154_00531 [Mycoplasmopsis verecunda]